MSAGRRGTYNGARDAHVPSTLKCLSNSTPTPYFNVDLCNNEQPPPSNSASRKRNKSSVHDANTHHTVRKTHVNLLSSRQCASPTDSVPKDPVLKVSKRFHKLLWHLCAGHVSRLKSYKLCSCKFICVAPFPDDSTSGYIGKKRRGEMEREKKEEQKKREHRSKQKKRKKKTTTEKRRHKQKGKHTINNKPITKVPKGQKGLQRLQGSRF